MKKPALVSVSDAAAKILRAVKPLGTERVPLAESTGRVLRKDIRSDREQPPYDRVTMDGFALNSSHWKTGCRKFPVTGIQRAGEPAKPLSAAGGCIEIMTGAVLPRGCDTIVPVEVAGRHDDSICVAKIEPGRFIHRAGSDLKRGDIVLRSGAILDGPAIAIAASVGCESLLVSRLPRIAIVSTGDEVVSIAARPLPHQIRASNAHALAASCQLRGFGEVACRHLPDDEAALARGLRSALADCDALIVTGGVSKGRFDFIPDVLHRLGVRAILHGVKQQPGKPLWFGRTRNGAIVFGLPGNPVSALVCLHRYVLPALVCAIGAQTPVPLRAELRERPAGPEGFTLFRPVRLASERTGRIVACFVAMKNSGDFFPLAQSDGFVEIPPRFKPGGLVEFRPWRSR